MHERNDTTNNLEQLAIIEVYRANYHILHGRETFTSCDNRPSVERATKLEKTILGCL